jgi:1-aminocyclopropane-1-carboxylate deaminase/D-cysteine desulfhydrase-like pyridoxal-dependent ACC family enzyme
MAGPVLTPEELHRAAARLPRVLLTHLPTPLDPAPRFARSLGVGHVFLKRDDCTGVLFGGNKSRHNEFLLADALAKGCDTIVWGGGTQSNNCRQTAAMCAHLGLECRLYLSQVYHDADVQGNLLLDHLMGAKVEIVDVPLGPDYEALLAAKAEEARAEGRKPYVWSRHTCGPLAAVSYSLCLAEIVEQMRQHGQRIDAVYSAGAGPTGAGLTLGKAVLGLACPVRIICPIRWPYDVKEAMAETANNAASLLGLPHRFTAADVDATEDHVGPNYGVLTPACREALALLARTEGVLLDPVYTAKAMGGLIADVRQGHCKPGDSLVFIHTGGQPAVFAFRDELYPACLESPGGRKD